MTRTAVITATGSAVPAQVETNDMLAQRLDTSDEWIRPRTGIGQRHVATTETTADLAVAAGNQALDVLGDGPEIDQLILATTTPDRACPAVAPEIAHRLGLGSIPAYDVAAVCGGFLFALRIARDAMLAGTSQRILVIASETFTRLLDPNDRATVATFGDGAGAVIVESGPRHLPAPYTTSGFAATAASPTSSPPMATRPDWTLSRRRTIPTSTCRARPYSSTPCSTWKRTPARASGTVRELGEGADGLTVGQEVSALTINGGGAYGQVAVTNAHLIAPLPEGLDIATAAVVPSNTTTVLIALVRVARLTKGESVLVQAAGGLGSQFGQVAKHLGADRVVGVVGSEEKRQAALDLGYDEVWLRDDFAQQPGDQFDVIADPVSGPARSTCIDLLCLGGRLLAVGDAAQAEDQQISSNALWLGGKGVIGFNLGAYAATKPEVVGDYFRRALDLVARGTVKVHVSDTVPIQSAPAVLTELRNGRTVGKTVFQHES